MARVYCQIADNPLSVEIAQGIFEGRKINERQANERRLNERQFNERTVEAYAEVILVDVLFLHGPAAAGKHTVGTLLSTLVDMPLFHNHLVVDAVSALFDFGTEPFIQLREAMWLAAFEVAADASRSFIFTFNPEATVEPDLIERLETIVTTRGGRMLYVELACSDDTVVARINSPSRAQFGKLLDPDAYLKLKSQGHFDFPPLPTPLITVDTEAQAPIESARMIADAYLSLK